MTFLTLSANIAFCIWIIFLDGADKLENTLVGYFEFGLAAEKANLIKFSAWLSLIASAVFAVHLLLK